MAHPPFNCPRGPLRLALVQSALANVRPRVLLPTGVRREAWTVPLRADGESLLADAYWQPHAAPALLLLHGVGGSSASAYVEQAVDAALGVGLHAVALNLRGVGPGARLARRLYHAGLVADVEDALDTLAGTAAVTGTALLGFSLGGQLALKFLADVGDAAPVHLHAAATVSAPFELDITCRRLDAMPYWPYRRHILAGLLHNCAQLAQHAPLPVSLRTLRRLRSLEAFDDAVTAPMHGFADARAYYRSAACGAHLARVRVPTLCIHAADDPIVPLASLRAGRARAAAAVHFDWTVHGGHVGFVAHLRALRTSWAVTRSLAFVGAHLLGGSPTER